MNHKKIKKQLLLYIDGDLSAEKKIFIANHLKECSECAGALEMLSQAWTNEKTITENPAPDLWFRLKDRIEKGKTNSVSNKIDGVKIFISASMTIAAVIVAVVTGSWLGRSLDSQNVIDEKIVTEMKTIGDEFGMRYFEVIPPNNLAESILSAGFKSERSK